MENTSKVFFEDDRPQWYLALGERWIGPLTASDIYQKILGQEITWAHFLWKTGQSDWMRICDIEMFQTAVPAVPARQVQIEVKEAAKPVVKQASRGTSPPQPPRKKASASGAERAWFLHYNETQYGPFSTEEIKRFLMVGKIHGRVHAWKDGMKDWERLEKVELFHQEVAESKKARALKNAKSQDVKAKSSRSEQRISPRRPLVAKIIMANEDSVIVGVCRDISIGGMQVLTDRVPGVTGTRIRLNVSPSSGSGKPKIEPFVAEGVIVRILEDGRGFSFRFERLRDGAKRAVEAYIASAGV